MKNMLKLAGIFVVLFLAQEVRAAQSDPDFIRSSATVSMVSVSSLTAVQIDATGRKMSGRFILALDNEAATDMRCGLNSTVTNTTNGFLVRSGTTYVLKLHSAMDLWCILTSGAAGNATLLQGKSE